MKKQNYKQLVIIITGPSGGGKTSEIDLLIKLHPELKKVVSITTRPIRVGEIPGENRIFVTEAVFEEMRRNGELACIKKDRQGNFYAIPKILNGNIIDLDLDGIKKFRSEFPNTKILTIGLYQSQEICEARMRARGDSEESILSRIQNDVVFERMEELGVDVVIVPFEKTIQEIAETIWSIVQKALKNICPP